MTFDHFPPNDYYSDYTVNGIVSNPVNKYDGLDFIVLPETRCKTFKKHPENIFIFFGGYDYRDLTLRVAQLLKNAVISLKTNMVVSNIYPHEKLSELKHLADSSEMNLEIFQEPPNFQELLLESDIALLSGGITFFQALSAGISIIAISQYKHQDDQISPFLSEDAFINLGLAEPLDGMIVIEKIKLLVDHTDIRRKFYDKGRTLVDGKGLRRVISLIDERTSK